MKKRLSLSLTAILTLLSLTACSARPLAAPQAETAAPQAETAAPQAETSAPQAETSAPQAETSAPQAETSAPQAETSAPQAAAAALPAGSSQMYAPLAADVQPSSESNDKADNEPGNEANVSVETMDIVACQGNPKDLFDPPGTEILQSRLVADVLPWSYYISDVRYDGQEFVMVWRDNPKGDAQWLCSVTQTAGDTALRHTIEYTEGSYEGSGEKFLYFTIEDAFTFHRSLWCFDLETEYFNRMLEFPCSNMIRLKDEPGDARGIGWIVYDHYLAAVDLAQGATYEGMTIDLSEYIKGSLFYEPGAVGTHKFVRLSDIGSYAVEIEVITAEPETSAPELREAYQMDILTLNFWAMQ